MGIRKYVYYENAYFIELLFDETLIETYMKTPALTGNVLHKVFVLKGWAKNCKYIGCQDLFRSPDL